MFNYTLIVTLLTTAAMYTLHLTASNHQLLFRCAMDFRTVLVMTFFHLFWLPLWICNDVTDTGKVYHYLSSRSVLCSMPCSVWPMIGHTLHGRSQVILHSQSGSKYIVDSWPIQSDILNPPFLRLTSRKPLDLQPADMTSKVDGGITGSRLRWSTPT